MFMGISDEAFPVLDALDSGAATAPRAEGRTNQDALINDPESGLFVVADGVGGQKGGEIASAACIEEVKRYLKSNSVFLSANVEGAVKVITDALESASAAVSNKESEAEGLDTTCSLVLVVGDKIILAQMGDSRIYGQKKDGTVEMLVMEDSLLSSLFQVENEAEERYVTQVQQRIDDLPEDDLAVLQRVGHDDLDSYLKKYPEEAENIDRVIKNLNLETLDTPERYQGNKLTGHTLVAAHNNRNVTMNSVKAGGGKARIKVLDKEDFERLAIVSDGVSDNLTFSQIRELFIDAEGKNLSAQELADNLLTEAKKIQDLGVSRRSKADDTTVVAVTIR